MRGLYLLTPDTEHSFDQVLRVLEVALQEGVTAVQYRNKLAAGERRIREARQLVELTQAAGALAIINDDVDLALAIDADGVHLGRDDGDPASARRRVGDRLLGVSCYDDLTQANRAVVAGADVIAFGSIFTSTSKPRAVPAPIALLTKARERFANQRVVAIGGIDATNIADVAAAGAHAAALIAAVFNTPEPRAATRRLIEEFSKGTERYESQRAAV